MDGIIDDSELVDRDCRSKRAPLHTSNLAVRSFSGGDFSTDREVGYGRANNGIMDPTELPDHKLIVIGRTWLNIIMLRIRYT